MRIRVDNTLSNSFNKRFKWIDIKYKTANGLKTTTLWNDGGKDSSLRITRSESSKIVKLPRHIDVPEPFPNQNLPQQPANIANIFDLNQNSWCGDPQHILYDEESKLFYMWAIARYGKEFSSDWFEWISTDMVTWKQNGIRLKRVRETNNGLSWSGFNGGSVIISDGTFVPKGHLMFFVTVQDQWMDDRGVVTQDQDTCLFLSEGFGKPIYKRIVLQHNYLGGDLRDSYAFYDTDGLYIALASGCGSLDPQYNGGISISKINSLELGDWQTNIDFLKAEPLYGASVNSGVEVPNVIRMNKGRWLVLYSDQYLETYVTKPKNYQSCKGWICTRENGKFIKQKYIQLDYGPDAYARRVCNPFSNKEAPYVVCQAMVHNWSLTSCQGSVKGQVSFDTPYLLSLSDDNYLRGKWIGKVTARYKGLDFTKAVTFGGVTFLNINNLMKYTYNSWNRNVWNWKNPDKMYVNPNDDIIIVVDNCLMQLMNVSSGANMTFLI